MRVSRLRRQLTAATCTLLAQGAQAAEENWVLDSSYLSYVEADDRVVVNKTLFDLERTLDDGTVNLSVVYDTMSGASPTGALRSSDNAVTFTGASGGGSIDASEGGDYSLSHFDDRRIQFGLQRERQLRRSFSLNYGGVVSIEEDYESYGGSLGMTRESTDKVSSVDAGIALTSDTIYRSATGNTPIPLSDTNEAASYGEGTRHSYDALLGYTRVINRVTVARISATLEKSAGYHSDPYKIISAADDDERILANYHDSRPASRLRQSLAARVVHQLRQTGHSLHLVYRWYGDDWGIRSNTLDIRYHHALDRRQYLEPHLRLYRQGAADFYYRKLALDESLQAVLPDDGFASADYRLDEMSSVTAGLKYGLSLHRGIDVRMRIEYIDKSFATAEYDSNDAVIFQTSLRLRF